MIDYLNIAVRAAIDAGMIALKKQFEGLNVEIKDDDTPVSDADIEVNDEILKLLKASDLPVLSEESKQTAFEERKKWPLFWMLDPIDGTKSFIKGEKDFTINIALIRRDTPVLGVVFAPASAELWYGVLNSGAWKLKVNDGKSSINELFAQSKSLPVTKTQTPVIIVTCSHMNDDTKELIEKAKKVFPDAEIKQEGSSLKFCRVAEGSADLHIRAGTVHEWDTAAGDAVLRAAGGKVLDDYNGQSLKYNSKTLEVKRVWAEI